VEKILPTPVPPALFFSANRDDIAATQFQKQFEKIASTTEQTTGRRKKQLCSSASIHILGG